MNSDRPRLLFFVTEDWFFCSHFLDRALAAREDGFDVTVLTRVREHGDRILSSGLGLVPIDVGRRLSNPARELLNILNVWRAYRACRPDIVHHIALKPIALGTIAARLAAAPRIVNAPVGMGFAFASESFSARLLRMLVRAALSILLNPHGSRVVFENPDDLQAAVGDGIVRVADAALIRGAGVDLKRFAWTPDPDQTPTVVLVARMLWEKGVGVFVDAARILRGRNVQARFVVAGRPDPGNPGSIAEAQLRCWHDEGLIEYLGYRADVDRILEGSNVFCLPSYYREGLPKALLEALAVGRPIVTTDTPGCREAVVAGENGLLVPPRDAVRLADAIERLVLDRDMRRRFGAASRKLAETQFSTTAVSQKTIALYREMLEVAGAAKDCSR